MSDGQEQPEIPERDRLPVERSWRYSFDGEEIDIRLVLAWWPEVTIRIRPLDRGIEIVGVVRQDGTIQSVTIDAATEDSEITSSSVRGLSALITVLKDWNVVAQDVVAQLLEDPDARTVFDAKPATDSLRALFYQVPRGTRTRRRGADAELLLRELAEAYKTALAAGDPTPRKTLAEQFGYTPEHISRLLRQARTSRNGKPPLLPPGRDDAEGSK